MAVSAVGISDISIYIPHLKLNLAQLQKQRIKSNPNLASHLDRALRTTGQRFIRFPESWEDTTTMAAEAAYKLLTDKQTTDTQLLRYLAVGTETPVDHSKPVSAYVEGMLQEADQAIPNTLASFQVLHACAGGTLALISTAALIQAAGKNPEKGIVICSDVSRYEIETTAEITQGAGAVAMLVEQNPKLIEINLATQGYCSRDVDDFFRPLDSNTARVKGRYSMQCYLENLEQAFLDHCNRRKQDPARVLISTDLFVLHAPFRNMPQKAMEHLLAKYLSLNSEQTEDFLGERGFYAAIDPIADIGNTYTSSMYISLAFLLADRCHLQADSIVGKNLLTFSYGSGNTMLVVSGKIAEQAPQVIRSWNLPDMLKGGREASFADYETWTAKQEIAQSVVYHETESPIPGNRFFLSGIRKDGYREYRYNPGVSDGAPKSKTPVDLHRPVPVLS